MPDHQPLDLSRIKTHPFAERRNKVRREEFGRACAPGGSFAEFWDSLPRILAGQDLREVAAAIVAARRTGKPVILAMGAHVIKCGLSPVVIDLMERRVITAVAMNGAVSVHDVEVALFGATSEEVGEGIKDGRFGMVAETGEFLNQAIAWGAQAKLGMGQAIGRKLLERQGSGARGQGPVTDPRSPIPDPCSLLAAAARLGLPATVHVAIGTDIHHLHPDASGEAMGATSMLDFRIFAAQVAGLSGGVLINAGSAVVMPTVIEKAIAAARNLGHPVGPFVGVNLDFIQHYRASNNPVARAKELGGQGYRITGHHELLIPLLARAVVEQLGGAG